MDACKFVGLSDSGIDALAKHPAPLEFSGNDAHAIGLLGMRHSDEVFGQSIVICNEHLRPRKRFARAGFRLRARL
jgi:hypothetical protein